MSIVQWFCSWVRIAGAAPTHCCSARTFHRGGRGLRHPLGSHLPFFVWLVLLLRSASVLYGDPRAGPGLHFFQRRLCSCGTSWDKASPPAASSHLCAGSRRRMSHPKTNPVQQSPDTYINAASARKNNRLLLPLGSPGCTTVNPALFPLPLSSLEKYCCQEAANRSSEVYRHD